MSPELQLSTYRRIVASGRENDEVHWWYFGTVFICVDGMPEIVVSQAETLMAYRSELLSDGALRIHWREVGYFRDPCTGDIADTWLNPLSGMRVSAPKTFEEGPGRYTIRESEAGLAVEAIQPNAQISSVEVRWKEIGNRILLVQTERKIRGFPKSDGSMPDPATDECCQTETQLTFFGDREPARGAFAGPSSVAGFYRFDVPDLPQWMEFGKTKTKGQLSVRGVIKKADVTNPPNRCAQERLESLFPSFFDRTE